IREIERPAPIPPGPRYSIFPKQNCQSSQTPGKQPTLVDPAHAESVKRGLSQQRRLSSLVPAKDQSSGATHVATKPACPPSSPAIPQRKESLLSNKKARRKLMSSTQLRVLDKFAKELEEFARNTECAERAPGLAATPTKKEAHVSVKTIQEFLPYQQQFQLAGLAVTSAEQKAPLKIEQKVEQPIASLTDQRLQLDGGTESDQGSSQDTKETSSDTAIKEFSKQNPPSLKVSTRDMQRHPTQIMLAASPTSGSSYSPSSPRFKSNMAPENSSPRRASPSAISLVNKPLPARPGSFGPRRPESPSEYTVAQKIIMFQNLNQVTAAHRGLLGSSPSRAPGQARFSPGLQQNPVRPPAGKGLVSNLPRSRSSFQVARDLIETGGTEKALPELPVSRIPGHVRQGGNAPPRSPAPRTLPTPIMEEKEPLLERQNSIQRDTPLRVKDNNVMVRMACEEMRDAKPTTIPDVTSCRTPEPLPETWKLAPPGTPSSFKQALDDVVRKLDDMEGEDQSSPLKSVSVESSEPLRLSPKVPSPSQRAATRREKMWGVSEKHHDVPPVEVEPVVVQQHQLERGLKAVSAAAVRDEKAVVMRALSKRRPSVRMRRDGGGLGTGGRRSTAQQVAHDDSDISDSDVLQGLKIICTASADHDFDAWIQRQTGLRLRRFLADLKGFEDLTEEGGGFPNGGSVVGLGLGLGLGLGRAKANTRGQGQARRMKSGRKMKANS
ncbi:hypothetical protein QBC37DRAFT_456869, partial [Rhypophila decipiens]